MLDDDVLASSVPAGLVVRRWPTQKLDDDAMWEQPQYGGWNCWAESRSAPG